MHGLVPKAVFDVDVSEVESPSMAPEPAADFESKAPTTNAPTPSACNIISPGYLLGSLLLLGLAVLSV